VNGAVQESATAITCTNRWVAHPGC